MAKMHAMAELNFWIDGIKYSKGIGVEEKEKLTISKIERKLKALMKAAIYTLQYHKLEGYKDGSYWHNQKKRMIEGKHIPLGDEEITLKFKDCKCSLCKRKGVK